MMNKQRLCTIGLSVTLGLSGLAMADNSAPMVPSNGNLGMFYYQVGGGNDTPMPAFLDTQTLPLNVSSNVGLGYNCGVFNPSLSIANAMNGIQNSAINIEQSIINNATGAIYDMPLYILSRANHTAYDILTNQFFNAQNQLNVSTKSCEVMQGEMANGQNPYSNWATIAMGDDWEKHMSLSSESASDFGGESGQDINQVKTQVDQDNGSNGIPWIHNANANGGGDNAGGAGQPSIEVIHDTVVAGYNVLLQANRNYDDTSIPVQNTQDAYLVSVWASPLLAADWVVNVVGDQEITTYAGGPKQSTPGVGLLSDVYTATSTIQQSLANLIDGTTPETLQNLQALASPSMVLNSQAIEAFRQLDPVDQSIYVHKLAQAMAAERVAEQVRLAKQLLMVGESVPEIQGNRAARKTIQDAIARIDEYRNNLSFGGSSTIFGAAAKVVEGVIALANQQATQNSAIQPSRAPEAGLSNGAVLSGGAAP